MEETIPSSATDALEIRLQDIERPEYMGKRVRMPMMVAGVGKTFSIPSTMNIRCTGAKERTMLCFDGVRSVSLGTEPGFWLKCIGKNEKAVFAAAFDVARGTTRCDHLSIDLAERHQTVTQLVAFPDFGELVVDSSSGQTVDEMGREWKRVDAFFLGSVDSKSMTYMAEGTVVAHPLTHEITMIIDKLEPAGSDSPDVEPVALTYDELEENLSMLQRFTSVKGRRDAHLWALLLYATPAYFRFDGELVEGWGRGLFFGDTTTGKGQAIKGIRKLLGKGKYLVAETASRAGLLYGISQANGTYMLVWGALPQADGELIIIDGSNNMAPEVWNEFLEAVRTGMLIVNKIVEGKHPCRTRLLLIGNPGNPPKALGRYPYQSLQPMFSDPFLARMDFAIPFSKTDVDINVINSQNEGLSTEENDVLSRTFGANVTNAWKVRPEELTFAPGTESEILRCATELYQKYKNAPVPIVSNDLKKKLAREAISLALLCGRKEATVEDVQYIVGEFQQLCSKLGLEEAKPARTIDKDVAEDVAIEVSDDSTLAAVVVLLLGGGAYTQKEVGERVGIDPRTAKDRLEKLRRRGLAEVDRRKWEATGRMRKVVGDGE